jgi:hypothetical protein
LLLTQHIDAVRLRFGPIAVLLNNAANHLRHGVKVLLKFKLLELQTMDRDALIHWARSTPYFARIYQEHFASLEFSGWVDALLDDLVRARAAARVDGVVHNVG